MSSEIEKLSGLCVITGASSEIGFELAKLAAKDGCDLILAADRDLDAAKKAVLHCGGSSVKPSNAISVITDRVSSRSILTKG